MPFVPPVARTTLMRVYPKGASGLIWATLLDEDGVSPLLNGSTLLTTVMLDVYEATTLVAINPGCVARNILNANNSVVYDAPQTKADGTTYNLKIWLGVADMACLLPARTEVHIALVRYTWGTPLRSGVHEIAFTVDNLAKVS